MATNSETCAYFDPEAREICDAPAVARVRPTCGHWDADLPDGEPVCADHPEGNPCV